MRKLLYRTDGWNSEWALLFPGGERTMYVCLGRLVVHVRIWL